MFSRITAAVLALSFLATLAVATNADAKRRCPPGQEDVHNVCRPK